MAKSEVLTVNKHIKPAKPRVLSCPESGNECAVCRLLVLMLDYPTTYVNILCKLFTSHCTGGDLSVSLALVVVLDGVLC